MTKFIAYFRVSTDQQGRSGLGLDAQRQAVLDVVGAGDLVAEFTEIESGKVNDRPQLAAALAQAKKERATLVIAKQDRLGRRAGFVLNLLDTSGIDFVFAENPLASELEIGIKAVVAQEEGRLISERTTAALAQAKARGVKLGAPDPSIGAAAGRQVQADKADRFAGNVLPVIRDIQSAGISSLREIASALNARGISTQRGGDWHPASVSRIIRRAA